MDKKIKRPIRREPIVLDKNAVALIHIFERYDELDDMFNENLDSKEYFEESMEQYRKSAQQFIAQLKDQGCVAFMENLIEEAFKTMVEEDRGAFTKKAGQNLIDKLKKINEGK
jgi:hypothetical protein